jgi:hypothetical protein
MTHRVTSAVRRLVLKTIPTSISKMSEQHSYLHTLFAFPSAQQIQHKLLIAISTLILWLQLANQLQDLTLLTYFWIECVFHSLTLYQFNLRPTMKVWLDWQDSSIYSPTSETSELVGRYI